MPGRLRESSSRDDTVWNRLAYSIIALIMTTILSMQKSTCKSGTRVEAALDKLLRRFSQDASGFLVTKAKDCYSPSESDDSTNSTGKIDADQCNTCSISSSVGLLSSLSFDEVVEEPPTTLKLENAAVQCSLISSDKSKMEFQTIEEEYTEISVNQVMPSSNLIKEVDEYLQISRNVSVLIGQGIQACINGADKSIDAKQSEVSSMLPNDDILKRNTFSRIGQLLETIPETDSQKTDDTDTEEPNDKLASRSKYFNLGSELSQFKSITLLDTSNTLNEIQKHHESLTSSLTNLVNRIKEQSDALAIRSKNNDRHSKEKEPTLSNVLAQGDMQNSKHSPNFKEKHKYKYRNKSEHNPEKHKHRRRPSTDQENKSEALDSKNSIIKCIEHYMRNINQEENAGMQLDVFESNNTTSQSSENTNHEDSAEKLIKQPKFTEKSNSNKEEDKQKLRSRSSSKAIKKKESPKHVELSDLSADTEVEKTEEELSVLYDSEKAKKSKHHVTNDVGCHAASSKKLESKPGSSENCKGSETSSSSASSSTSRVKKPSKAASSSPKKSLSSLLGGNCVNMEEILSRYAYANPSRYARESLSASSVCSSISDKVKHSKSKSRDYVKKMNESYSIPSIRNDTSTSRVIDKEKSRRFSSSKKDIHKCKEQPSPSSIPKTKKSSHRSTDDDLTDSSVTAFKTSSKSTRRKSKQVDAFIEKHTSHRHSRKGKDTSSIPSNKSSTVKTKELKDRKSKSKMPFEKLYKSASSIYQNRSSMEKILFDSLSRAQSAPQRSRDFNIAPYRNDWSKCSLETKCSIPETSPGTYSDGFLTKFTKSAELSDTKRNLKVSSGSNKQREEKPTKARKLSMTAKERQLKSISYGDLCNNKLSRVKRGKKSENSPASPELYVRKTKDSIHIPVFRDKNAVEPVKLPDSIIVPPISFEPVRKRVSKKPTSTAVEAQPLSAIFTHRPLVKMPDGTYHVPSFVMNVPKSPVGQSRTLDKSKQINKSESNHSNVSDTFNDISQLTALSSSWDIHKAESTILSNASNDHKDESVSQVSKYTPSRRLRKQESINISDSDSSSDEKPVLPRRRSGKKSHKCQCDRKRSNKTVHLFESSTTRPDSSGHRSKGNQIKPIESLKFKHSSNMSSKQSSFDNDNLENVEAEYLDAFTTAEVNRTTQSYLHPRTGDAQEDVEKAPSCHSYEDSILKSRSIGSTSLQAKFYELEQQAKKLLQSVDKKIMPTLSKNKSLDECVTVSIKESKANSVDNECADVSIKESKVTSVDKCVSTEECLTVDDTKLHSWFKILNTTESTIRVLREKVANLNAILKKSDKNCKYLRSLNEDNPEGEFEQLSFEEEDAVVEPGKKRTRLERSPYFVRGNSKFRYYNGDNTDPAHTAEDYGRSSSHHVRQSTATAAALAVPSDTSVSLLMLAIPVKSNCKLDDYVKHKKKKSPR